MQQQESLLLESLMENSSASTITTSTSQQEQQQPPVIIIRNWTETPFDPTDTRPFIRNPVGRMLAPCGLDGPKCVRPLPWIWMFPAILLPLIYFLVVVLDEDEIWPRIVACLLAAASFITLILSNVIDPGIIPPARVGDPIPRPVTIHINDVGDVELEVCRTCKILRPPRSSHCTTADVCVRDYDHYCGVINSVVGMHTFRWFTWFMWAALALVWFIGIISIIKMAVVWDFKTLFDTNFGRFRIIGTILLVAFLGMATCWTLGAGCIYCQYAGTDLTLKDLKGRKTFKNTQQAYWTCSNLWIRLCSCNHYPESVLHENMTFQDVGGSVVV
jgi:hypothetical protein